MMNISINQTIDHLFCDCEFLCINWIHFRSRSINSPPHLYFSPPNSFDHIVFKNECKLKWVKEFHVLYIKMKRKKKKKTIFTTHVWYYCGRPPHPASSFEHYLLYMILKLSRVCSRMYTYCWYINIKTFDCFCTWLTHFERQIDPDCL